MSRRDFLKASAFTLGAGAAAGAAYYLHLDSFFHLPEAESRARLPLPACIRGISVNSPFIWRFEDCQDNLIDKAHKFGISTMRLFADDMIEPDLGEYDARALDRLQAFAKKVEKSNRRQIHQLGLTVDLADCYGMLPRSNPVYGSNTVSSPYSDGTPPGYAAFFSEPMRRKFVERMNVIMDVMGSIKSVVAWGIMNELSPPAVKDSRKVMTDWFTEMISECRGRDGVRPILTGLADPFLIDESEIRDNNTVNTIHIYPFSSGFSFDPYRGYLANKERSLALYPQEMGFPMRFAGHDLPAGVVDRGYGGMIKAALDYATFNGTLETNGLGLWKWDGYDDGYPDPFALPHTSKMLQESAALLQ